MTKKLFDKLADYFLVTQDSLDTAELIKARVLVNSSLLAFVLISLSVFNRYVTFGIITIPSITVLIVLISIPILFRLNKSFGILVYILPILSLVIIPILVFMRGGFGSSTTVWFAAIPIVSLYFLGPKRGLIFSLIGLGIILSILALHISFAHFIELKNYPRSHIHNGIVLTSLFVFATYLTWHYEKSNIENQLRLRFSETQAKKANRTKDVFWANMSHEIKTPLNGILGMTNLLLDSRINQDQRELLRIIQDSAENLNIILSDVIDYSKLETHELEIIKKPFLIQNCLDEVIKTFSHMAQEKKISLSYSIDNDVPEGILSDQIRLKQVITNLVANAIKFTDQGFVKIIVETTRKKDRLKFIVEDTGIGISLDKRDKLFKPFTQVDDSSSRRFGGAGLGLVIAKRLSELLGGQVNVESRVGQGSSFQFTIEAIAVSLKKNIFSHSNENQNIYSSEVNILVVEDNPVNRRLLVTLLNKNGHNPTTAENGKEALEKLEQSNFDIIFMDLQMPVMDGLEATKKILSKYGVNRPKIIAVTANAAQEDRDKCFEVGMDDFMAKPINNNLLVSIIERYSINNNLIEKNFKFNEVDQENYYFHPIGRNNQNKLSLFNRNNKTEYSTFNVKELFEHFADDIIVIETIIEQFSSRYNDEVNDIANAIEENNIPNIKLKAHSFKGSFSSLFSHTGMNLAITLEKAANLGNFEECSYQLNKLEEHCIKLSQELKEFISNNKPHY